MYHLKFLKTIFNDFVKLYTDPLDDFSDRLSSAISVTVLVMFAVMLSAKLYFAESVACLFPPEHQKLKHWNEYYTSRCFIEGTYRMTFQNRTTSLYMRGEHTDIDLDSGKMSYYMWSPYVLVAFAFCFAIPKMFRNLCLHFAPVDYETVVIESRKLEALGDDEKYNKYLTAIMEICCYSEKSRAFGVVVALGYVIMKWLYVINACAQFSLLKTYIGDGEFKWGWDMLVNGVFYNQQSRNFPVLSYCRIDMEAFTNEQVFDYPCVLPINVLNEKVYIFLWFWLLFVAAVSFFSALYATIRFVNRQRKMKRINDYGIVAYLFVPKQLQCKA